jgi:hypothetical protein
MIDDDIEVILELKNLMKMKKANDDHKSAHINESHIFIGMPGKFFYLSLVTSYSK